jgi:hypothetical protein
MGTTDNFTRDHRPRCEAITGSGHRCRAASTRENLCRIHHDQARGGFVIRLVNGGQVGGTIHRPPATAGE